VTWPDDHRPSGGAVIPAGQHPGRPGSL